MDKRCIFLFQSRTRVDFLFFLEKVKLLLIVPGAFKDFPLLCGREVVTMMFLFLTKSLTCQDSGICFWSGCCLYGWGGKLLQGNRRSPCYHPPSVQQPMSDDDLGGSFSMKEEQDFDECGRTAVCTRVGSVSFQSFDNFSFSFPSVKKK